MFVPRRRNKNSFFKSIQWVLVLGQICGLMPIRGIFGPNHRGLRFTWKNPVFFYTLYLIGMTIFYDYVITKEVLKHVVGLDGWAPTVFYTTCLLALLMFLNLARKFPEIAKYFSELEKNMADYPKHLGLKTKIFITIFASLAIVEHGTLAVLVAKRAERISRSNNTDFGETFYKAMHSELSEIILYSPIRFAWIFSTNVICTLSWNYLDFFLIAISMQIYSRLGQINERVSKVDIKKENCLQWLKILQNYNQLSKLVKKLDKLLSKIIISALLSDIYHVSLNLLRILKLQGTVFQNLYIYFSTGYLIVRLLTLLLCLSQIESESKKSLDCLYCIKKPTMESDRFLEQITTDDVYFTGDQFFVINRKFMTTVIGTIITFQVILLQFESLQIKL